MTENMKKINKIFDELVPASGKADTVAGEIVRAVVRIIYRFYNDGDVVDIEYGKETCNAAARFIMEKCNVPGVNEAMLKIWGYTGSDEGYEVRLDSLCIHILEYLEEKPELKFQENDDDMHDWSAPEDQDWDEDDWDGEWDDEEYDEDGYEDEYEDD